MISAAVELLWQWLRLLCGTAKLRCACCLDALLAYVERSINAAFERRFGDW